MSPNVDFACFARLNEIAENHATHLVHLDFPPAGPARVEALQRWLKENCQVFEDQPVTVPLRKALIRTFHDLQGSSQLPGTVLIPVQDLAQDAPDDVVRVVALFDEVDQHTRLREAAKPYFATLGQCDSPVVPTDVPTLLQKFHDRLSCNLTRSWCNRSGGSGRDSAWSEQGQRT